MNIKQALRYASAILAYGSVIGTSLPLGAQAAAHEDQTDYLFYNTKIDHSFWFFRRSASYTDRESVLVCDAETGHLYKATAILSTLDKSWGKLVGTIDDSKMVYVRYPNGAAMDVEDQMDTLHLSIPERVNVRVCVSDALIPK